MNSKKGIIFIFFLLLFSFYSAKETQAAITSFKDILSTSRPSASAPLQADQAANATQVTIYDNQSIFLASDSAKLLPDTGETLNTVTIASMSALNTPSAGQRIIYFTSGAANTHHNGDPIVVPVTAKHTISFITTSQIDVGQKIKLTFPGSANNTASPSASTFAFNNITSSNVSISGVGSSTCSWSVSSPSVTCTVASANIAANATITITLGSSTPQIINPTKTPGSTAGESNAWSLNAKILDSGDRELATSTTKIATVDSVQVYATVEPTLTVVITGLNNNVNFSTITGCASETTNSGFTSSATEVNLGVLSSGIINRAGQKISVSTNAATGYSITATSSGRFIDPSIGYWLAEANGASGQLTANDTPAPAAMPASGNERYGIFPCGQRVPSSSPDYDDELAIAFGSGAKGTNPWNSGSNGYYATIATYTGGAIDSDETAIRYAATVKGTTPAGLYSNVLTYVTTATF